MERVLARGFDLAKPDEYQDLHGFYQKVAVADESLELVLPPGAHVAVSWSRYAPEKPMELPNGHLRWEVRNMPPHVPE